MSEAVVAHRTHAFMLDYLPNVWRCDCGAVITDEDMFSRFAHPAALLPGSEQ